MRKNVFILAAAALLFAGCAKEVAEKFETASYNTTISAVIDGADTKAALADDGTFTWQEGDKIAVYTSAKVFKEFVLTDGAGTKKAQFGATLEEGETATGPAVYPAVLAPSYVGPTEVKVTLPETYTYEGSQTNVPMTGTLTSGVLAFKQVGGVIKFSVSGIPDDAAKLVVSAKGFKLTGTYNSKNSAAIKAAVATDPSTVTINFSKTGSAMDFYLPVPTGVFSNLGISLRKIDDTIISEKVSTVDNEITRGKLLLMPAIAVVTEGNIATADELIALLTLLDKELSPDTYEAAIAYTEGKTWQLVADIDLTGKTLPQATGFAGTFDGQGHSLMNWTTAKPMLAKLTGTVKNVVIDKSCVYNAPTSGQVGFLLGNGEEGSLVKNCVNNADITVTAGIENAYKFGSLIGRTAGFVKDCINNGSISINVPTSAGSHCIGGVLGYMEGKTKGTVYVEDCVNNGSLTFRVEGLPKKTYLGGVIGASPITEASKAKNIGTVASCINNGPVTLSIGTNGNGTYVDIGGVIGYLEGDIKKCENYAPVRLENAEDESGASSCTRPGVGGVAGYVLYSAQDCLNEGLVRLQGSFAAGSADAAGAGGSHQVLLGGVFGGVGPATENQTEAVTGCVNKGKVQGKYRQKSGGSTQSYVGGIVGYGSVPVKECVNYGKVDVKAGCKTNMVGGVVGRLLSDAQDNQNLGDVDVSGRDDIGTTTTNYGYQNYIGGIVGFIIGTRGQAITGCENKYMVSYFNGWSQAAFSYVGGVLGSYDSNGKYVMTNCFNKGPVESLSSSIVVVGGVAGGFNGEMTGCENRYEVRVENATAPSGKEPEVGGLVGYANATFKNCVNKGPVVSTAASAATTGGFVGGFGEKDITWEGCKVDASVTGPNAGAVLGWFRKGSEHTITLGTEEAKFTVTDNAKVNGDNPTLANLAGNLKASHLNTDNVVIGGGTVQFSENLAEGYFTYDNKKYNVVKLADNRWWMAAPLAYVPEGKTVSDNPVEDSGIWYTYTTDGKTATPNKDFPGYLYDVETALGLDHGDITFGTKQEFLDGTVVGNFQKFEGAQGICPPGWYIPTREDFYKLIGYSTKNYDESADPSDPTAPYYIAAYKGSNISKFDEVGWNFSFMGVRAKTSKTQTGAYNLLATDATKCSVAAYLGKPSLNQIMTSTGYMPTTVNASNVQFFCVMSTFTASYKEGRLNLGYLNYLHGAEVRCVRKPTVE